MATSRLLLPTLIFLGMVVAVVSSLGAPLIPTIALDDHVSLGDAQWSLTITLLVGAVATPIMGRLGDGRRRRPVMLLALSLVTLGSVLAALPLGFGALVVGRGLQGVGLGLTPLAIATARDSLPPASARGGMAMLSITTVAGIGLGYPLTGLIAQFGGLHIAYWFGTAVSLAALLVAFWILPSSSDRPHVRLDVPGAILLGLALAALLLLISEGEVWGWLSPGVLVALAVSVLALAGWIVYELRCDHPLVALRLLRHRSVLAADIGGILAGVGMYLLISLVVRYVQTPTTVGYGLGASVVVTGLVLVPFSAASFAANRLTPLLLRRSRPEMILPLNAVLLLGALLMFSFARGSLWEILIVMALAGLGVGAMFAVMPGLVTRSVAVQQTGSAMSFNQVLRYVGYSAGSAISAAVLSAHTPAGAEFPREAGYTAAGLAGCAVWIIAGVAGLVLSGRAPDRAAAGRRIPAPAPADELLLAEESLASAIPDDEVVRRS